jgi:hypothetical protein
MTQQAFQAMLAELFRVTGSCEARALPGVGHFRCSGLDVAVYYDEGIDPSNVHAYVDFGPVAPTREQEVFRTLLSRRPSFMPTHSAVVGLDADSNRIVLVARIAFDETLDGRRVAAILTRWIREVGTWLAGKPALRLATGKPRALRRRS